MLGLRHLSLVLALLPLAGCVAVVAASAAGVGLVQYQKNELARDFPQGIEATWQASMQAMERLGYGEPTSKEVLPTEAETSFEVDEESVKLRLETRPEGGTRLIVRVGQFDSKNHRRKAQIIVDEVAGILADDVELRAWSEKVQGLDTSE